MEKKEKIYSESGFSGLKDFQEKNLVNPIILSILIQMFWRRSIAVLFLLFFISVDAFCQDKEVSKSDFNFKYEGVDIDISQDRFKQKNFFLGFQWSGTGRMSELLYMNARASNIACKHPHSLTPFGGRADSFDYAEKMNLIIQPGKTALGHEIAHIRNAASMTYEPGLHITHSTPSSDMSYKSYNDSMNPVFGFRTKNGGTSADYTDGRRRLELRTIANIPSTIPVISNPWPDDQFFTFDGGTSGAYSYFDGKKWYLTINLRSINMLPGMSLPVFYDPTPVLKIKLPYTRRDGSTGTIKFKVPTSYIMTLSRTNRGDFIDIPVGNSTTDELVITKGMIEAQYAGQSLSNVPSITIAIPYELILKNEYEPDENPYYKESPSDNVPSKIIRQNIEVYYMGNMDIAIDYIRIENKDSQDLHRGLFDTDDNYVHSFLTGAGFSSIKTSIEGCLASLANSTLSPNNKLFRFYGQDTESWYCMWWDMMRYWSLATGGISLTRDNSYLPNLYRHHTKSPNRYIAMHLSAEEMNMAAPYFKYGMRYGSNILNYFGYKYGYKSTENENNKIGWWSDSLNSGYETMLHGKDDANIPYTMSSLRSMDTNHYINGWYNANGVNFYPLKDNVQCGLERELCHYFYDIDGDRKSHLLFDDISWWMNLWPAATLKLDTLTYETTNILDTLPACNYLRPKTGEEIRLITSLPVLLGAKGVFLDRETNKKPLGGDNFTGIGDGMKINPNLSNFLSDEVGEDYYTGNANIDNWGLTEYIDLNTVTSRLGIPVNKFYTGVKSTRSSIERVFRWIRKSDTTLMNLRLLAWRAKSYKTWYHQHPDSSGNILSKYIDVNRIKTYPVHRLLSGNTVSEQATSIDSGFYDITLLKSVNDHSMQNGFYIGVQNRRTDPLILYKDGKMKFIPTVEFDSLCGIPSYPGMTVNTHNPSDWQDYWWKRLGCREIRIPLIHTKRVAIRITELGADSLSTLPYRNKKFYHTIDTAFYNEGRDGTNTLIVRLLPGEGKMLKVEYTLPALAFRGDLSFSNQHKIVCYPTAIESSTGKILKYRYHATYMDASQNNVYYRRSHEMSGYFPENTGSYSSMQEINWEDKEILISDPVRKVRYYDSSHVPLLSDRRHNSFKYPSIVVRPLQSGQRDLTQNPYVYIVFQGNGGVAGTELLEAKFTANTTVQSVNPLCCLKKIPTSSAGQPYSVYGTPVINASANYNYYAWTEAIEDYKGLIYSYKESSADFLPFDSNAYPRIGIAISYYNENPYTRTSRGRRCFHPSFNNYSRIDLGENDCALVWQEMLNLNDTTSFDIFYTRIGQNGHYVPQTVQDPSKGTVEISDNIAKMSNYDRYNHVHLGTVKQFPVVYRGVEKDVKDPANLLATHWDRVMWRENTYEMHPIWPIMISGEVALRSVDIMDACPQSPTPWWQPYYPIYYYSYSNSSTSYIAAPYISQGTVKYDKNAYYAKKNLSDNNNINISTGDWHITQNYWSFINTTVPTGNPVDLPDTYGYYPVSEWHRIHKLNKRGTNTHLANLPYVIDSNDHHLGRRIYEGSGNMITSSGEIFLKKSYKDEDSYLAMFGYVDEGNSTKLGDVTYSDKYVDNMPLSVDIFDKNEFTALPRDTVRTQWMKIENSEISFVLKQFGDANQLKIEVEEYKSEKRIPVQLGEKLDTAFSIYRLNLLNGANKYYRLNIIKHGGKSFYSEDLFLGGISIMEQKSELSMNKQPESNEVVRNINLNSEISANNLLDIYPNPANNELFINIGSLPADAEVFQAKIYSILGSELMSFTLMHNITNSIDISGLANGSYYIETMYFDTAAVEGKTLRQLFVIAR